MYTTLSNPLLSDSDDDGFPDGFEVDNGYSPISNQHQVLLDYIAANGASFGLYTTNVIQDLNVDTPLLQLDTNGQFKVTIGIQTSTNLPDFVTFPMTEGETLINGEGALEFRFSPSNDAEFYRLRSK